MAHWRVGLLGPLLILKDGEPAPLRTRQQALLLARLAADRESPADREATAALLWPEAGRENALAYLRRAVMELRREGLEIASPPEGLRLESPVVCDVEEMGVLAAAEGIRKSGLLTGCDHPLADEIRGLMEARIATPLRAVPRRGGEASGDAAYAALGRLVLARRPEAAVASLVGGWEEIKYRLSPERLLELLEAMLETADESDPHRPRLLLHAGWAAYMTTRYPLAESRYLAALGAAERAGDGGLVARALLNLTSLESNRRCWAASRGYADRAIAAARASGDAEREGDAHLNRANLRWRVLDLDGAVEDYRRAWELCAGTRDEANTRLMLTAHLTFLRAAFGCDVGDLPGEIRPHKTAEGFGSALDLNLGFWLAMERGDAEEAAGFGIRRLEASTAQGMESVFCYALDDLACLLGRLGLAGEAAACVRIGTRVRRDVGTLRGLGERAHVRRHVAPPFFSPEVGRLVARWLCDEPAVTVRRIAGHLAGASRGRSSLRV